jgi:hypothetical protein
MQRQIDSGEAREVAPLSERRSRAPDLREE